MCAVGAGGLQLPAEPVPGRSSKRAQSQMEEFDRRTFCALAAATGGLLAGCNTMEYVPGSTTDGARVVASSRTELESAFEELSPGDTVYVSPENAPYRTEQWLDVDVDGVTVVGPGVRTLIKPAAGAGVGGIRIGHHERCRDVTVRGVGYDGNPDEQPASAERLHGVAVRDAANVTVERNHIRGLHPERHGDGGSGVSVTRRCSRVRISENRIHDYGDRGIQVAGEQIQVFGNVVTDGPDRAVACDLWYPDGRNHAADNVVVFGNLLGESREGSLVGIARNVDAPSRRGYVSVFGNVGFGSHKSFCHLRGPRKLRNVSVQNNVSVHRTEGLTTEATTRFSGVAVDAVAAENVSIKNNELYGYRGHGVRVESEVDGLSVQDNTLDAPALCGVLVSGAAEGVVSGNRITRPGEAGVRLVGTDGLVVDGNHVSRAGTAGIVTQGSDGALGNDITSNYVVANSQRADRSIPGVLVLDSGVSVRGNTIERPGAHAIAEGHEAGDNLFADNRTDADPAWRVSSPTSTVRNNEPPVGVHRGVEAPAGERTVTVRFDRPHARAPRLSFGRTGGGIESRRFRTDEDGNFVAVTLTVQREGTTLDVFVEDG